VVKSDYRYDVGVLENCKLEVDALCTEAKTKLRGSASVLKCLVQRFGQTGESCQVRLYAGWLGVVGCGVVGLVAWGFGGGSE